MTAGEILLLLNSFEGRTQRGPPFSWEHQRSLETIGVQ